MSRKYYRTIFVFSAVAVFLAISAFFMVNVKMPDWAYLISGTSIVFFAAPTFWAAIKWLGFRNGLILLVILGIYALLIESLAIATGIPYGNFSYSEMLGFRLFGLVPWSVAFAWTPLILAAYTITRKSVSNIWLRFFSIPIVLVVFDLVLDPGAVYLGFWKYKETGFFYGVPLTNFAGWIISGIIGAGIIEILLKRFDPPLPTPTQLILSGYFTILFWTFISLWAGMIVPCLIGIGLTVGLSWFYFRFQDTKQF